MKLKSILLLLAGGVVLYLIYRRSQVPSNFSSLSATDQSRYLSMLDAANAASALGINAGIQ
jgi:hypothetical protein